MKYLYLLLIIGVFFSCEKDAEILPKSYPVFKTNEVQQIDSTGATFSAQVESFGNQKIIEFGFIVEGLEQPLKYVINNSLGLHDFSFRCQTDLLPISTYWVKAFVTTENYTISTNEVSYVGAGSLKAEIIDFEPKEGFDRQNVSIICKNISSNLFNKKVFLLNKKCEITTIEGDTIHIITPDLPYIGNGKFEVVVNTSRTVANDKYYIKGPEINDVSPSTGKSGSIITISGKYFTQNGEPIEVFIGNERVEILSQSDSTIICIAPPFCVTEDVTLDIKLKTGLKSIVHPAGFKMTASWKNLGFSPWVNVDKSFIYDNRIHILNSNSGSFFTYDSELNIWQEENYTKFPGSVTFLDLIFDNDILYVQNYVTTAIDRYYEFWSYDFKRRLWKKITNLPFLLGQSTNFKIREFTYVVSNQGDVWKCDFVNENYIKLNKFPQNIRNKFASAFVCENEHYLVTYGTTYKYDELSDKWLIVNKNPFQLDGYDLRDKCFSYKNTGYVVIDGFKLYRYSINHNKWFFISRLPDEENTFGTGLFVLDDKVYVSIHSSDWDWERKGLMYSFED